MSNKNTNTNTLNLLKKMRKIMTEKYANMKNIIISDIYNGNTSFSVEGLDELQIQNIKLLSDDYCKKYNAKIYIGLLYVSALDKPYFSTNALRYFVEKSVINKNANNKGSKFITPLYRPYFKNRTVSINQLADVLDGLSLVNYPTLGHLKKYRVVIKCGISK